jgi:hypothetical protein
MRPAISSLLLLKRAFVTVASMTVLPSTLYTSTVVEPSPEPSAAKETKNGADNVSTDP